MYLDAFWVGVATTIFVQLATMFVWAVISVAKRGKK